METHDSGWFHRGPFRHKSECMRFSVNLRRKSSSFVTPDDSARKRKMHKMMSLNCSICFMPVFGVGKVYRIWTPKGGPPQFSTWMFVSSFLPFVVSLFLVNFWNSWGLPSVMLQPQKQVATRSKKKLCCFNHVGIQLRWKLASNKTLLWSTCVMRRASCFEQLARFHTAKNGIATHYCFSLRKGPFRGCFQCLF